MQIEDFTECSNYLSLVDVSNKRKLELFGDNSELTYSQLRRRIKNMGIDLEVHHRVPRYRMKHLSRKEQNIGNNLMLLTPEEHILAHYYLMKFETNRWYYSAAMAFIQITSLKQKDLADIDPQKLEVIVRAACEARQAYFGSGTHIQGAKKAGLISGQKRKERMESDPEFAEYIKSRLFAPGIKEAAAKVYKETVNNLPFWDRPGARKSKSNQLWQYSYIIFLGVKNKRSYKKIGAYLKLEDFNRIKSCFTILKVEFENLDCFRDWRFYEDFIKRYPGNMDFDIDDFEAYCKVIRRNS